MPTIRGTPTQQAGSTSNPLVSGVNNIPNAGPMRQSLPRDSFGVGEINPGAVGQALSNAGRGAQQLVQNIEAFRQRVATTEAEEAVVQFERAQTDVFFNPESGYFNTQGRNAYDLAKPTVEQLEEIRRKAADELKDDQARSMFMRATDAHITRARQDIMRHASDQFDAWEAATIRARVENTLENATLYWDDPERRAVQLELGRQGIIDAAMIKGSSPEVIAEELQTYNSQFAVRTIEAALAQRGAAAAQVALADNKSLLEAPDLVKIQGQIDRQFSIEKEQRDSDLAVMTGASMVQQYGDQSNARQLIIDEVNTIEDAELRSKTMREAMHQLDNKRKADSERRAAVFDQGQQFLLDGGSLDAFIAGNPNGWADLTAEQKRALQKGPVVETDYNTLSDLMLMDPEKLAKVNPADYFHKLKPSDREQLIKMVQSARQGTPESQVGRSRTAQVTATIERLYGEKTKRNNADKAKVDEFYALLDAEVRYREQEKGSTLSPDEFTALLNDMTRKVVINRSRLIPGSTELDISDIPVEAMGPISQELRRRGYPVTADNLLKMYEQGWED